MIQVGGKTMSEQILNPVIEGLNILAKYYPNDEVATEYDGIYYAPYEPEKISQSDLTRLAELGWHEYNDAWYKRV